MIVVAGEALVDLIVTSSGAIDAVLGGAPFNTARAAARLGADVAFVGTLSTDRFGRGLRDALVADGVDVDHAADTDLPTTLALAEIDADGSASYHFYVASTSAPALVPGALGRALGRSDGSGDGGDIVFTGGLGLVLEPMAGLIAAEIDELPDEAMVVVDVNCRPAVIADRNAYLDRLAAVVARADVVKVSDEDLAYLEPSAPVDAAAARLLDAGPSAVVVTAGASHTSIVAADGAVDVPVPPSPGAIVDTIGAGDTFGAGLLAWWAARGLRRADVTLETLAAAVAAGHTAAGIVVTRRGADPPHRDELPPDWT